ncbi:MAG: YafY family protein [Burkholderiaceae bacterium]|nr:YafY family protein [Burkholderiaceae bacterium]
MSRSGRLLGLLQLLRGRRTPITSAELARELGVSERTIYRDIATLLGEGAPIIGEAGMGYILGPGLFLPPLMLDVEEVEAILLGLRYVSQRGDDVLQKAVVTARAKISSMLPAALQVAAFDEPLAMPGPIGEQIEGLVPVSVIRRAIRSQEKLEISYANAQDDRTSRVVWPIAVIFMESARIVGAWCELRQDFRTFRIDRILSVAECGRYTERRTVLLKRLHAALLRS